MGALYVVDLGICIGF